MTTKFNTGDRVRVYERSQSVDGFVHGIWPDGSIRVTLDGTGTIISYHPKQLRRLVKRKRVVWESVYPIGTNDNGDGLFRVSDQIMLDKFALSKFIGKRVRIEITEAKEKP